MAQKNVLDGLKILKVSGVTLKEVGKIISRQGVIGDKEMERIFSTEDNGVLIQLRPTDRDADSAFPLLVKVYGDQVRELTVEERRN